MGQLGLGVCQALVRLSQAELGLHITKDDLQDLGMTKRSDDSEDCTPDQNLNCWTIENPNAMRQSNSLNSLDNVTKPKAVDLIDAILATDLVATAEDLLTAAQKDKIEKHNNKVAKSNTTKERHSSIISARAGPSKTKGKGVDPSNWGNVNLNQEELDLEAQQAALESLKQGYLKRKAEKPGKMAETQVNKKAVTHELAVT